MVISDKEKAVILPLQSNKIAHRAKVIAKMQFARSANARNNYLFHGYSLFLRFSVLLHNDPYSIIKDLFQIIPNIQKPFCQSKNIDIYAGFDNLKM